MRGGKIVAFTHGTGNRAGTRRMVGDDEMDPLSAGLLGLMIGVAIATVLAMAILGGNSHDR